MAGRASGDDGPTGLEGAPGDEVIMNKAEIDALVRAHRGRARPVAFFHVLRQDALGPDDNAFLLEHAAELNASDLLRWRARCESGFTGLVMRQLARRAIDDPALFQHEVLDLPRLELSDHEWTELAELVRGKVPGPILERILSHGGPRPPFPPSDFVFTPGVIERGDLELDDVGGEDWSVSVWNFPDELKEAVLERARRTTRGAERANLLWWLESHEVPRATLMAIALSPIAEGTVSRGVVSWLSRQFGTRAAWEKHGKETLCALMAQRAFAEIGELVTVVWSEASRASAEPPRGLLEAIQVAFGLTLVDTVSDALARGDEQRALAALSALACLDPPSRLSRAVHELRHTPGVGKEVAELIAVNERLVKHGDARDATLEGVIAALHAVADAFA